MTSDTYLGNDPLDTARCNPGPIHTDWDGMCKAVMPAVPSCSNSGAIASHKSSPNDDQDFPSDRISL